MEDYRVGLGFDIHKITTREKFLVLAGYKISCGFGLEAVSDGDVVLHAVADAICGASCLGDIGDYFLPAAEQSKGLDSKKIISFILDKIKGRYKLINIDITLVADKPKFFNHKKNMLQSLKAIFGRADLNLKIKSKEGTQVLGGPDTISCLATALVLKIKDVKSL